MIDKLLKQLSSLGDTAAVKAFAERCRRQIAATKQEIIAGNVQPAGNTFQAKLEFKKLLVCNTAAK